MFLMLQYFFVILAGLEGEIFANERSIIHVTAELDLWEKNRLRDRIRNCKIFLTKLVLLWYYSITMYIRKSSASACRSIFLSLYWDM